MDTFDMNTFRGRLWIATSLSLFAGLTLTGCSGHQSPSIDVESSDGPLATIIEQAKDKGASETQLALLLDGEVSFAEYEESINLSLDCMRDAGIDVIGPDVVNRRGFPEISYSYASMAPGLSEDQTYAISQKCLATNSQFVEIAYQMSPTVLEAEALQYEKVRDEFVACIINAGGKLDATATRDEAIQAGAILRESGGKDCIHEVGLY